VYFVGLYYTIILQNAMQKTYNLFILSKIMFGFFIPSVWILRNFRVNVGPDAD